uniref:Altered inheritance of mitochondria protein 9, mitochondrial n=1 Tax=Talaromyces marneffei PM1 TaxID=1077442 RepID=A0A093VIL6_TALMA
MSVPIPTILDWSNEPSNSIGSEYIIMEHVEGVQLHKKWPEMAGDERDITWFSEIAYISAGTTLDQYCDGLVDAGLSRIPPKDYLAEKRPSYHGSVQAHLDILQRCRSVLKEMCKDPRIQAAATLHPDLHKRNIFVSETDSSKITGIIDWQWTSIEPAFWYADDVPDFAVTDDSDNNLCAKAFGACTRFLTPKLSGPRLMDDNLFRPFLYSYRTWKDGAVALRHEPIETTRKWNELGFVGQSPYPLPLSNGLVKHEREYKLFVAAQELKHDLWSVLNTATDGWVPIENWEATELAHREIFDSMLTAVLTDKDPRNEEPVKDEAVLRSIWPFDLSSLDTSSLIGWVNRTKWAPGQPPRSIAKQTLIGHDTLHKHNICHGDLHTRNLVFAMSCLDDFVESDLIKGLGQPETGYIRRRDGKVPEPGVPENVMRLNVYQP